MQLHRTVCGLFLCAALAGCASATTPEVAPPPSLTASASPQLKAWCQVIERGPGYDKATDAADVRTRGDAYLDALGDLPPEMPASVRSLLLKALQQQRTAFDAALDRVAPTTPAAWLASPTARADVRRAAGPINIPAADAWTKAHC